jgi:hypothetical protein
MVLKLRRKLRPDSASSQCPHLQPSFPTPLEPIREARLPTDSWATGSISMQRRICAACSRHAAYQEKNHYSEQMPYENVACSTHGRLQKDETTGTAIARSNGLTIPTTFYQHKHPNFEHKATHQLGGVCLLVDISKRDRVYEQHTDLTPILPPRTPQLLRLEIRVLPRTHSKRHRC